jgi:hypothetical protein
MPKLVIVASYEDLSRLRSVSWDDHFGHGGPAKPPLPKVNMPCLMDITVTPLANGSGAYITTVICTKSEAKRLVYPKTNSGRSDGSFLFLKAPARESLWEFIKGRFRDAPVAISPTHPLQIQLNDHAMSNVEHNTGNILVSSRVINAKRDPGIRLMDFYIVDEASARKLVYWQKKRAARISFDEFMSKKSSFVCPTGRLRHVE